MMVIASRRVWFGETLVGVMFAQRSLPIRYVGSTATAGDGPISSLGLASPPGTPTASSLGEPCRPDLVLLASSNSIGLSMYGITKSGLVVRSASFRTDLITKHIKEPRRCASNQPRSSR